MNTPTATLETASAVSQVAAAIDTIAGVDARMLDTLRGPELLSFTATLEALGRRVDALRVTAATTVQRRSDRVYGAAGLAQSFGFRTGTGLPLPALFPVVAEAFTAVELGIDAAELIGRELATAAPRAEVEMLAAAEQALVGQATGHDADTDTESLSSFLCKWVPFLVS
jgi:hypothetical protein